MKKVKVLFVCLGNICRSPMGAAILKKKVADNGMEDWVFVDSCGTSDYHIGDDADPRTRSNAQKNNVPMNHCARQLTAADLDEFDYIFAMDRSNFRNIMRLANGRPVEHKIKLMREFDPEGPGEVPDPYHGDEADFQEVFDMLDRSTENFIGFLQKNYKTSPA